MPLAERVEPAPTCDLDERNGDVLERLDGWSFAVVTGPGEVVLGKLLRRVAEEQPDTPVRDSLTEGPTTVRALEDPDALAERMEQAGTSSVLVTTKEGQLMGGFRRA